MRPRSRFRQPPHASWAGTVVAVALACLAGRAEAQAEAVPLTWNAPAGCPPAAAVVADVKRNLADSGKAAAPFVAAVSVERGPGGRWQAHLRVEARGGRADIWPPAIPLFRRATCGSID